MTHFAQSDGIPIGLCSGEEVYSFFDIITVLVLPSHVITSCAISGLVTDFCCLKNIVNSISLPHSTVIIICKAHNFTSIIYWREIFCRHLPFLGFHSSSEP